MAERGRHPRRSLAGEEGVALVFAVQVLAILTLLIAGVMASALALKDTTKRDYNSKQALAAALSGIDVARYRINKLSPGNSSCVTDRIVSSGSGGQCPAYSGDLGNGVTYAYTVGTAPSNSTCGGTTIAPGQTSNSRCVTATGTAGGVTRRVQALIRRGTVSTSLFPFSGMVGLSSIAITENNNGTLIGQIGTNGTMTLKGCTGTLGNTTTFAPGPTASMSETCAGTPTSLPPQSTPWTLSSLDPIYSGTQTTNDNATVFGSASGFSYNATSRSLSDTSNATLIINGSNPRTGSNGIWTFNFCKFTLTHVTQIKLQNNAVARFLFDSNQRTGSGCSTAADVDMTNVSGMNYDTSTGTPGNPANLQFMFYGTGQANITNKSGFAAAWYAPTGTVKFTNDTTWYGAIAADTILATNGLDFTAGDVSAVTGSSTTSSTWVRTTPGFVECQPTPTSSNDQESGC